MSERALVQMLIFNTTPGIRRFYRQLRVLGLDRNTASSMAAGAGWMTERATVELRRVKPETAMARRVTQEARQRHLLTVQRGFTPAAGYSKET